MRNNLMDILKSISKKNNIFTFEELFEFMKIDRKMLWEIVSKLEKKGYIKRIEKGKYLIVPLSADKNKYTLHEFLIGSMLVKPYAISYWSALNYYGFTEQIPSTVFVQTTSRKKRQMIEVFGVNYKIVRTKENKFFGIKKEWIENTQIDITDKEKTIIDCLDKPQYCGGIIEVIKSLKNGYKELDFKKLSQYANKIGNSGVIRRLGFICDLLDIKIKLPLMNVHNYLWLDPTMPKKGKKNAKWRLIININEKIIKDL